MAAFALAAALLALAASTAAAQAGTPAHRPPETRPAPPRAPAVRVAAAAHPAETAADARPDAKPGARSAARATLDALLRPSPGRAAARYTDSFLAQVPAAQVDALVADMRARLGTLRGIDDAPNGFLLRWDGGDVPARIALDEAGRIAGLWFGPVRPQGDIAAQAEAIRALPGRTSLLVLTDGRPRVAHAAQQPLAVGSAAKLAILLAARREAEAGKLRWADVVPLDRRWKSPGGGPLHAWPDGAPVTLDTLANLMISVSDNTATDALLHRVGREAVEAISPRNTPFPGTRELFLLKTGRHAAQRAAWRGGDAATRRAILRRLAGEPAPALQDLSAEATPDVEWFMTAQELCGLLDATADLPSLRINPGLANAADWRAVAYKGGSEPGVLNLSTRLQGRDGRTHCVVATWNDNRPLDEARMMEPYRGIIAGLAEAGR